MANPTTDDLSKWYSYRSCVIERLSRQVDLSVELVKLATERGVEVSVKFIVNPAHATTSIRGHYFKALVITNKCKVTYFKQPLVVCGHPLDHA
jgi:hypothetical protein